MNCTSLVWREYLGMRRKLSAARFSHTPDRAVTMNSESCTFRWTITFLLCFEIFQGAWGGCGPVPRLEYAMPEDSALNQNIFLPNATVAYNCRPGYRRIPGSRTLTCQEDYTWSTPVPFCTLKSCGNPGDIDNGEMHAKDFLFGSRVTYTCNEGYRMISKRNYRDCEADSTWSNAPPECEVTICQAPALTSDVSIDPMRDEYSYLDVVRFICQKPLEVAGNNTAFCTSEGTWSSDAPTCKAVNCIDPNVANSRRLSGFAGPYKLNSAISFACNGNLVLKGSSTIVCNINSEWTPGIPECKEVSCGNLGTIANGKVTYENDLLGAKATYECDTRYALSASENTRICQKNEMWSGSAPSCIAICEDPITPPFANRIGTSSRPYFNGTVVHFSCKRGFVKSANKESTITCQGHSWSRHDEFCERISCGPPGQIPHGYVDALDHLFGSLAKYTCEEGYVMSTMQDYRTCQEDGKWSEEISCIEQEPEPGLPVWIIIVIVIVVLVVVVIIIIVVVKVYKKSHQKGEYYCDVKADKFVAVCVDPQL